jgi:hypothetical protein
MLLHKQGHKEDTILSWLRQAASHAAQVEDVLMAKFRVKRGQMNVLQGFPVQGSMLNAPCSLLLPSEKGLCVCKDKAEGGYRFMTPAMAAGLTDHPWSVKELLTVLPLPRLSNT